MRKLASTLVCLAMTSAAGCSTALPQLASAESPLLMRQLIIKFRANTLSCDAASIARLASQTGIALEFLRPMSGEACVVRHFSRDESAFSEQQSRLRLHPAIELVEQDRVMKTL